MIPFNKPYFTGKETQYIQEAVASGKISGDGIFTQKCHEFFQLKYQFKKNLLTTSCTDALEMAAILLDIQPDDEIIIPSYTFVSTANAFVLRGAKVVFADSSDQNPNIDVTRIRELITERTKAIVVVHYAGIACDMEAIEKIAKENNIYIIEDAAQAIDSFFTYSNGDIKPLGSIGDMSTFSFHETKNIISGEGGMLVINNNKFITRAEIIREKGTNRSAFFRGEVNKYGWVDIGSSFLPSDIIAAFLYAQLEHIEKIQDKRKQLWLTYWNALQPIQDKIRLPYIPQYATNNAHMFYIICKDLKERTALIEHCRANDIHPVFHYLSLHKSEYYIDKHDERQLPMSDFYTERLLRLPLYYELEVQQANEIAELIIDFYREESQEIKS